MPNDQALSEAFAKPAVKIKGVSSVSAFREIVLSWHQQGIRKSVIHRALVNKYDYNGSYCAVVRFLQKALTGQVLKHRVAYTGVTSSLAGTCRYTFAAAVGFVMGFIITKTAIPLSAIMLICSRLTAACMMFYLRHLGAKR